MVGMVFCYFLTCSEFGAINKPNAGPKPLFLHREETSASGGRKLKAF